MRYYNKEQVRYLVGALQASEIVAAVTEEDEYEGGRIILAQRDEIGQDEDWLVLVGSHCSCFWFDEARAWEVTAYTKDELEKVFEVWTAGSEALIAAAYKSSGM